MRSHAVTTSYSFPASTHTTGAALFHPRFTLFQCYASARPAVLAISAIDSHIYDGVSNPATGLWAAAAPASGRPGRPAAAGARHAALRGALMAMRSTDPWVSLGESGLSGAGGGGPTAWFPSFPMLPAAVQQGAACKAQGQAQGAQQRCCLCGGRLRHDAYRLAEHAGNRVCRVCLPFAKLLLISMPLSGLTCCPASKWFVPPLINDRRRSTAATLTVGPQMRCWWGMQAAQPATGGWVREAHAGGCACAGGCWGPSLPAS